MRREAFKTRSLGMLLSAVVDFACICVVKLRFGTGGGGGLLVGRCATGFCEDN